MTRCVVVVAAMALVSASASFAASTGATVTPVGRVPFPERAYIVDLPRVVSAAAVHPKIRENGLVVAGATLTPISSSDVATGVVLAIDASQSMAGKPLRAALGAAGNFIARRNPNTLVGLVTFNGKVTVDQELTTDGAALRGALQRTRSVAYGTRIFDAIGRSIQLLESRHVVAGSVVVLSDGADVGSTSTLKSVLARASGDHIRIFAVGLHSRAFDPAPLRRAAAQTNGTYAEATGAAGLGSIYAALGSRLASEYLLRYTSAARPGADVDATFLFGSLGRVTASYTAPTASGLAPYHQSLASRFFLSTESLVVLSLLASAITGFVLYSVLSAPRRGIVERIEEIVGTAGETPAPSEPAVERPRPRVRRTGSAGATWLRRLEEEFEIGEISLRPESFVLGVAVVTFLMFVVLAIISIPLALLAFLVPVFARIWVTRKVKSVRDAFADLLPETLQLLASALRSGHSLIGAMTVVVERAPQPLKREFGQVLTDDQLGVPLEQSLRRIARRMKSRDMEQVGLLGELQRTVGGNAAEVLDTVVETVRERAEVRRLAQTMTAQGRLARWILTVLPVVLALMMLAMEPKLMKPMLASGGGQLALVVASLFVVAGSLWIKKIVEIEV